MAANSVLREVFLSRWPPTEGPPPGPELDRALRKAVASVQAAWPRVDVPAEGFVAYLAEHADTDAGSPAESIDRMQAADVGLCFACLQGTPAALAALDLEIERLGGIIGRIDGSAAFVDEVKQVLRVDLLMGRERSGADAHPRIVQYRGRAPLQAWLRVIATRLAIDLRGKAAREVGGLDELIAVAAAEDPELEHLRGRHLGEFRAVLNQAVSEMLAALDVEARNLLRWHLVDNLSLRKIAIVRGEHVSAVSRQYARIRAFILDRVRQRLKEHTGLPTKDLDSVMAALRSQISLSSCAILRAS